MKIVIKATHIADGGGLTHLNKMVEWFGKLAPNVSFVLIGKVGQERVFVEAPPNFTYQFYRFPAFNLASRLLWERFVLRYILEQNSPDLLFEPGNTGTLNASCPRIALIHNIAPFDSEYINEESFYQRMRQRSLRRETINNMKNADGVIMLSQYCQEYFSSYISHTKTKTTIIYHGRPEGNTNLNSKTALAELTIPEEYILSVSHVWRYKKLEELVTGYLLALNDNPHLPCLVHAGAVYDDTCMNGIMELVHSSPHAAKVKFLGNVDNNRLQSLYQLCSGFVFTSVLETCSVILLEAMGNGCAMACSNRSVVPEICGDAAIYFDPYVPEDIARNILRLCEDKSLNDSLREKAKNRAKNFSWEGAAAETLKFFNHVLNGDNHLGDKLLKGESRTSGLSKAVCII